MKNVVFGVLSVCGSCVEKHFFDYFVLFTKRYYNREYLYNCI